MYLLQDGSKLRQLRAELDAMWEYHDAHASTPSWTDLEKAPYLSACVTEGLRYAPGIVQGFLTWEITLTSIPEWQLEQ